MIEQSKQILPYREKAPWIESVFTEKVVEVPSGAVP
jgi:hypothetical protein